MKGKLSGEGRKVGDGQGKPVTEGQYSLLDRGKKKRDKDKRTLGDGVRREPKKGREMDGWIKRSWHGVREHLVGEFWVILLTVEPPSQTKTLVQIESKSADKALDVDVCSKRCFEEEVVAVAVGSH